MNKVITINLNGRAYQLEESGFHALQKYLDQAAKKMDANPDKDEVMADFEQAIADKCDKLLNGHKTVVTSSEIDDVIKEMGPVDDTAESNEKKKDETKDESGKNSDAPKKLFQIREGAMLSGVCMGLAVYFNIDVSIVRIAFLIMTTITHGGWILVYFIMSWLIPYANTSEEQAEARGVPFNAQELLQSAKEKYANFDKEYWKSQKKTWKKHAKFAREQRRNWENEWYKKNPDMIFAGTNFLSVISAIIMGIISVFWVWAIFSLITTGLLFGTSIGEVPLWVMVLIITCLYNIALMPIRAFKMNAYRKYQYNQYDHGSSMDGIMWLMIFAIIGWAIWKYVPQSQQWWAQFVEWGKHILNKN